MSAPPPEDVSQLLLDWKRGDSRAMDRLMPILYEELKRLARHHLRGESEGHTLQTTALVHEAYLRLVGADVAWEGRRHFFAVAAQVMRRVLVDHARGRGRSKRGGGLVAVGLQEDLAAAPDRPADLVDLDEALGRLSALDQRKAQIIDLLYFGGLSYDEAAAVLEISPATVHRDLRLARAWLYRELGEAGANDGRVEPG
ncbi:MAG: sigma-70 family RNA polymerase sigma factor [Gemmatimonadetes bacterium]|jgi:RNA polymerase sigma-70 factor (ECF subfamily)|nr:sigma-70 family RNA polymerase sigma factor [Gemmatimonadota bacterium]MBP6670136.1 sigma-70 family RNA polymerase sigma factor [Gemmatimonadales bacterium]MBK6781028.1 sigma-70 family RNA polymerase sigma factor [Gemmatimonadota bacterium]MBK7351434.1 sigma-70 family RNA polymerase sigma factor [Gemmatimonadota bacterium]MBK7716054.1 sigma-70 family RNA polymerase sigma factor [Gemmatimonadota bacterium]